MGWTASQRTRGTNVDDALFVRVDFVDMDGLFLFLPVSGMKLWFDDFGGADPCSTVTAMQVLSLKFISSFWPDWLW